LEAFRFSSKFPLDDKSSHEDYLLNTLEDLVKVKTFIFLAVTLFFFSQTARAADLKAFALRDGTIAVSLVGRIQLDDGNRVQRLVNAAYQNGQRVSQLWLNSGGGSLQGGYSLAIVVQKSALSTFIPDTWECASACFIPFAAGVERVAATGAWVGVHRVIDSKEETDSAKASTIDMVQVLKSLRVSDQVIGKIVTTPPGQITWLTQDDLASMKVALVSPSTPEDREYLTSISPIVKPQNGAGITPTASDRALARSLNKKAIKLIRENKTQEAVTILIKATNAYPFDVEVLGNLGYALFLTGDYPNARDFLALALKLNPKRWASRQNLGMSLSYLGKIDWAVECFKN
jgi:hypothetical protein